MIKIVSAVTLVMLISTISGSTFNAYAGVNGGFSGDYEPANWNFATDGDGTVDETNAPDSITLTGSDGGCGFFNDFGSTQSASRVLNSPADHLTGIFCGTFYEITIQCAGTVSFDWDYETFDDPGFDPMGFLVNDDLTGLTDSSATIQSGSASVPVQAGDIFGFVIDSTDDFGGEATTEYSEFSGPNCLVGGEFLPIDTTALLLAGAQTNAVWIMSALAVIGSIAFGALYLTSRKN